MVQYHRQSSYISVYLLNHPILERLIETFSPLFTTVRLVPINTCTHYLNVFFLELFIYFFNRLSLRLTRFSPSCKRRDEKYLFVFIQGKFQSYLHFHKHFQLDHEHNLQPQKLANDQIELITSK